jgi:hypothetical protein
MPLTQPTPKTFAGGFDALGDWRVQLGRSVGDLARFLIESDLADGPTRSQLELLRERIGQDKLVVAFVAEFSRGKSELINAIFFSDAGRRILPATPGRTTMCPVELAWDADEPPSLLLLPIDTRLDGHSLAELRGQPRSWTRVPLLVNSPDQLAEALLEVMRTRFVAKADAEALGFWDDARPDDNPPVDDAGRVEVPAWRHALINYPHPLLKQGLVVLDTPGLNAIGAEPELTLGLLPTAHATVFILGADTGVTKSDLAIWRDHLGAQAAASFVVLNKIDALVDPLATPEQVAAQIDAQHRETARTLGVDPRRVFPLSARQALAARVEGDPAALAQSRLPALEEALGRELLPQRSTVLEIAVRDAARQIEGMVARRLGDRRRQLAEQTLELRGLRGKSGAKVRLMLERVDAETKEFEQATARLQAMRSVHARMLKDAMTGLATDRLREEVATAQAAMTSTILNLGARKAFVTLCQRLRSLLAAGEKHATEIRDMLDASFAKLNAEFGFSLAVAPSISFQRFQDELTLIETSYVRYLGLGQAVRLSQPKFMEQFRRMLVSKLRVVFENASAELELWNKSASAQVESQLKERRRGFRRRREALERIQSAAGELELRLAELEGQDRRLHDVHQRMLELTTNLCAFAETAPTIDGLPLITIDLPLEDEPAPQLLRHAAG